MSEKSLDVKNLTVEYETENGTITAVSNATFSIGENEFLGLVGESGCGKSTVAKAIIRGLDPNGSISSGSIEYNGKNITEMSSREFNNKIRWNKVSYIPQGSMNSLDPLKEISVQATEIAQAHSDMSEQEAKARFEELFDVVGISKSRMTDYPHQFSGGMKQRVIIAIALLLDPDILIADEPTTALDVIMQDQIFNYITNIKSEFDTSMLLITHDISITFELCDRMSVMHSGQLSETASCSEIYHNPRHPYTILLQEAIPDIQEPSESLRSIEGHPPQLSEESAHNYCHFADRCPWAISECYESVPELVNIDDSKPHRQSGQDHLVSCFRKDENLKQELESEKQSPVVSQEGEIE